AARVIAAEVGHQRARIARGRRAEHQGRDLLALADIVAHGPHRLAVLDDDDRFDPALVEDFADRGADHALDAQPLLLLDRVLDSAELDEVLRLDDPQHLDPAVGLGRAAGGEAQRDRGFGAVVDHHQIGAFRFVGPHVPTGCVKPRLCASARLGFRRRLDRNRRIRFEPRSLVELGRPMPIELKMPALSPTMEEGTLAKWLVKEGDDVKSGDILAEIETDKATMEFEAVDEGKIAKILVPEGTDGVKVGAPIAIMAGEGEDTSAAASAAPKPDTPPPASPKAVPEPKADATP